MPENNKEWNVTFCAGYVVPPCKGLSETDAMSQLKGSVLPTDDPTVKSFVQPLFLNSLTSCRIHVGFRPSQEGTQFNAVRQSVRRLAGLNYESTEQKKRRSY